MPENDKKINAVLNSLDGLQRAEPAPWFYSRVKARLERSERNVWEKAGAFLSRPAVAVASLVMIVGINAFMLFQRETRPAEQASVSFTEPVEEYVLASTSSNYDYENVEP